MRLSAWMTVAAFVLASGAPGLAQNDKFAPQPPRERPPAPRAAPAQPRPQPPPQWRPDWAKDVPEQAPDDSIGVVAFLTSRDNCRVEFRVVNATDATVRYFHATAEFFAGRNSAVTDFSVRYIDPGRTRAAEAVLFRDCPSGLTRIVIRQVSLCDRDGRWRRGCGADFVPIVPRFSRPVAVVPVEMAPDYDD